MKSLNQKDTWKMNYYCEFDGCTRVATTEWRKVVKDPDDGVSTYSTHRCDHHPETEAGYEPRPIQPPQQLNPVFLEALRPYAPTLFTEQICRNCGAVPMTARCNNGDCEAL